MSTIEDFENAPIGATATRDKGARVMKTGDVGRNWVSPGGSHLDNKEMVYWGYTLDPFPAPTTAREALALAWDLAHPVKEGQVIPSGTEFLLSMSDGFYLHDFNAVSEYTANNQDETYLRTLDPLPDPEPDWLDAPAVMARLGNWVSCADPQVFTRMDKTGTQWSREAGEYHWTELEDVTPLYPVEG